MGLMDKATDKIAGAISGTKIETIKVSYCPHCIHKLGY